MKRVSVLTNALGIMVLLGLLAALAVISVSPWYFFGLGRPPMLSIGYVQTRNNTSIYLSVKIAVEDINRSVKTLSPTPPFISLKTGPDEAEKLEDQFEILFKQHDVRVFLATSAADVEALHKVPVYAFFNQLYGNCVCKVDYNFVTSYCVPLILYRNLNSS